MRGITTAVCGFMLFSVGFLSATTQADMPKGLWQAFSDAQHTIEADTGDGANGFKAQSPGNNLVFRFGEQGLTVKPGVAGQDWILTMGLVAFGQASSITTAGPAEIGTDGRRIEYRRAGITEWYVNQPQGLEQGFTLDRPAGYNPAEPVILSLSLSGGLTGSLLDTRRGVSFATPCGKRAFDYKGLKAFDNDGIELPAELVLNDGRLEIRVEAGEGPWPIVVDPVISTETKLQGGHDDAAADDWFGYSVSVSGDTALVGSYGDDDGGAASGSAYVFVRYGGGWVFQAKLTASDAVAGDQFGSSVSVSGDTALVGSPADDDGGAGSGSAYVYVRSGTGWSFEQKLTASDAAAGDLFGSSVSMSGDTALVGAYLEDGLFGSDQGSAYVFFRSGNWKQQAKLIAADAADDDYFGCSVSVDGDTALVGAMYDDDGWTDNGSAYVFFWDGDSWDQQDKLTAPDAANADYFGFSVSVSADTALIGAPTDDDGGADNGSAYVFLRSGVSWSQEQKLTASDAADADHFGWSVSLSADTALIGAPSDDDGGSESGSAYVFYRDGISWSDQQKLTASDAAAGDAFGWSVSLSGDIALVGAEHDDDGGSDSGAAYAFVRSGTTWSEHGKLVAVETVASDRFGHSVSVSGDTALVAAYSDDEGASDAGAVYVFVRSGAIWSQQAKLVASDADVADHFGNSISVSGDTALIGTPFEDDGGDGSGSAYVYVRSGTTWSQQAKLIAADAANNDHFGASVSLSGDTGLIGARDDNDGASGAGSAYVFVRSGTGWGQQAKLVASDPGLDDHFGDGVSLSGETGLVGAPYDDDGGSDAGSVYVFVRSGSTWSQQAKLTASDAATGDHFGSRVSASDDTALVGAYHNDAVGSNSGTAYMFNRSGTAWSQQAKLTASDAATDDWFGYSVSVSGDTALVGACGDDDGGIGSGSAYVFVRGGAGWIESAKLTAADADADDFFGGSIAISGDIFLVGASYDDDGATDNGSAYAYCFDCGFGAGIAPGRWTMIGIPCDVGTSNTVEDIFGDHLLPSGYLDQWVVYRRDEAIDRYVRLNLTSTLSQGRGYWLYSTDWGVWDANGSLTAYVQSGLCASSTGCYEVTLTPPDVSSTHRWNLVGHPGNQTVNWAGVGVLVDSTLYTPNEAEVAGYISKTIYKYNGSAYESYDDFTPGLEGTLEAHEGIWVEALGASSGHTLKLLIPDKIVPGGPPGPPMKVGDKKPPTRVNEWYVRIIAESPAESLYDTRNVLGQLIDSVTGKDSHDLPELAPFSTPYLTIVFPHEDWEEHAGDYSSDFHGPDWKQADEWIFQVKSDSPWREVRLAWAPVKMLQSLWSHENNRREWTVHKEKSGEALMAKMWIKDLDTGEMIKVAEDGVPQDYLFNMDGRTLRTFRWILKGKGGSVAGSSDVPENRSPDFAEQALSLPPNDMLNPPRPGREK